MKKIAQIILAVAIVALVYVIYDQISTPIKFDDELKAKKAQVIDRIKEIDIDCIPDSSYVAAFIAPRKHSIFREIGTTEKPDILAAKLAEGRVGILVGADGLRDACRAACIRGDLCARGPALRAACARVRRNARNRDRPLQPLRV